MPQFTTWCLRTFTIANKINKKQINADTRGEKTWKLTYKFGS